MVDVCQQCGKSLLRCGISIRPTSASGHSRRSDRQQGFAECPLCLQWRPNLCAATNRRDVPFATECTAAKASLFDHLVGAGEDRWRHSQTERLGGLEVEHQLILSRHLHRQIGRLLALENAIDVSCRAPVGIDRVGPVGDQAAAGDEVVDFAIKLRYQRQFDEAYESLSDCLMSRASPIRSSSLSNSFAASSRRRCEGQRKLRERYSCAVAPLPS
jgi:hypothetical protein